MVAGYAASATLHNSAAVVNSERQVRKTERLAEGLVAYSVIGCEGIAASRGALQHNVPQIALCAA